MTEVLRLDIWLWRARFFKSRRLASDFCKQGRIRVDGTPVAKPHFSVRPNMVLTFPLHDHIRVIKVIQYGTRRGPAPEARTLYEDLSPIEDQPKVEKTYEGEPPKRDKGAGRPTKADRRALVKLRSQHDEW